MIKDTSTGIQGIDISRHQGKVDFAKVAASGMRFCILKATEGSDYVDPRFMKNWEALQELGGDRIYRGAYHFARPDSVGDVHDAIDEATDFCSALQSVGGYMAGALPPAIDFEKYSDNNGKENIPWIEAFVKTVEDKLGRSPMIYTGANVWRYELGNTDRLAHLPLWQVDYTKVRTLSPKPTPWKEWTFWQWSGGKQWAYAPHVPGIPSGSVDVNRFNGDEQDLARLAMWNIGQPHSQPAPSRSALLHMLGKAENEITSGLGNLAEIRKLLRNSPDV